MHSFCGVELEAHEDIGHTVTVFGATGFLGRYVVNRLGTRTLASIIVKQ